MLIVVRTAALVLAGAWLGLVTAGNVRHRVGPFDATFSARLALRGQTIVELAPLGSIRLNTHDGPLRLRVRVDEIRLPEGRRLAQDPSSIASLQPRIEHDAVRALQALAVRAALATLIGAAAVVVLWERRPRSLVVGVAGGVVVILVTSGTALATRHRHALLEPRYSGVLRLAPQAVGDIEDIVNHFSEHRAELSGLVTNVARLYQEGEALTPFSPGGRTIRVLHVSDVHLNPEAFDVMAQVIPAFHVDAVIDTGDINDWGSSFEAPFADHIASLKVPYVFVRGNHDSLETQAAVAAQPNAVVLDSTSATVAGLRIWGIGDPRFTPDKTEFPGVDEGHQIVLDKAPLVADEVRAQATAPDIILVHDPALASAAGGLSALVLAGHLHRPVQRHLGDSLELVEGSTGGAGLRGLQRNRPVPLTCSVLYFDRDTHRLRAYDRVTVASVVAGDVRIERHVVAAPS